MSDDDAEIERELNELCEWTDANGDRWFSENGITMRLGKSPRECNAKRVAMKRGMKWLWPTPKSSFKGMHPHVNPEERHKPRGETAEERRRIVESATTPWKGLPAPLRNRPAIDTPPGKPLCTFGEPEPGGTTVPGKLRLALRFVVSVAEPWRVRTGRASPLKVLR